LGSLATRAAHSTGPTEASCPLTRSDLLSVRTGARSSALEGSHLHAGDIATDGSQLFPLRFRKHVPHSGTIRSECSRPFPLGGHLFAKLLPREVS